jgi:hypothetical protein
MALRQRTQHECRRKRRSQRKRLGTASLEVVMTTAVMLPIAAAILWLGFKMASIVYQVIGGLVAWPFL